MHQFNPTANPDNCADIDITDYKDLEEGSEVDFEEQIINTLTGKEKCLHDYFEQVGNGGISDFSFQF